MTALSEAVIPYEIHEWGTSVLSNYTVSQYTVRPPSSIVIVQWETLSEVARETLGKIKTFYNLRENWDSYGAEPPSKAALQNAFSFVKSVDKQRLPIFFTAPGPNGEVLVELKQGDKSIEVTFEADGTSSYAKFEGVECVDENNLSDQNLYSLTTWLLS